MQDEWVISRVFQKTGGGGGISGVSGGGKKSRLSTAAGTLLSDVGSPSTTTTTTSLPPLLDSSPYADGRETLRDHQHVPCFSTGSLSHHHQFGFGPTIISSSEGQVQFTRNEGMSSSSAAASPAFPSLRSLQDNLQIPNFFFSAAGLSPMCSNNISSEDNHHQSGSSGNGNVGVCGSASNYWPVMENQKVERGRMQVGATELDCMWTY